MRILLLLKKYVSTWENILERLMLQDPKLWRGFLKLTTKRIYVMNASNKAQIISS